MAWRERLREIAETPWSPIGAATALGGVVFIVWILLQASTGDRWVPILDHANLAFHEAGHLIVGMISDTMAVYGGTIGQLVFPIATAYTFWSRRNTLGFALSVAWGCESLLNIATYMGDARAMSLPLIGGLDPETHHDWREILTRWGMLDLDTAWADLNRGIAWTVGLWVCWWLARRFRSNG